MYFHQPQRKPPPISTSKKQHLKFQRNNFRRAKIQAECEYCDNYVGKLVSILARLIAALTGILHRTLRREPS